MLFELGVMAIEMPEELGARAELLPERRWRSRSSRASTRRSEALVDVQNTLVTNAVLRFASEELREARARKLASGTVGAYALSEAAAGSDAFALQARAVEDGDHFVLNGRKLWITNAGEAGSS